MIDAIRDCDTDTWQAWFADDATVAVSLSWPCKWWFEPGLGNLFYKALPLCVQKKITNF